MDIATPLIGLAGVVVGALLAGLVAFVVSERQARHASRLAEAADNRADSRAASERLRQLWSRQVRLTREGVNRELWSLTALAGGNTKASADLLVTKGLDEDDWNASLIGDPGLITQFMDVILRPHEPGTWPTTDDYVLLNVLRMRIARALDEQEETIARGDGPHKSGDVSLPPGWRSIGEHEFLVRPQRGSPNDIAPTSTD